MANEDIDKYINGQKAKATKYKENSDLNIFTKYCKSINEHRSIDQIPAMQLDNILSQFFINARSLKG